MQISLSFQQDTRLPQIAARLKQAWPAAPGDHIPPLDQLVFSYLNDRSEKVLAMAAYKRLRERYRNWREVRDAMPELLLPVLRGVTDPQGKAIGLPRLLGAIEDRHGMIELDFLAGWTVDSARDWLCDLPGVTPAMASATLSFSSLRRSVLTLDGDTARTLRRLGLAEPGCPLSAIERQVAEKLPTDWTADNLADFHDGVQKLARAFCHQGRPDCRKCPLSDLCPGASRGSADIIAFPGNQAGLYMNSEPASQGGGE